MPSHGNEKSYATSDQKRIYQAFTREIVQLLEKEKINSLPIQHWVNEVKKYEVTDIDSNIAVHELLSQAHGILKDQEVLNDNDKDIYQALDNILLLDTPNNEYQSFFSSIEKVIQAAIRLEKQSVISPQVAGERIQRNELINYLVTALDMVISKYSQDTISKKVLEQLTPKDVFYLVVDTQEKVRFQSPRFFDVLKKENLHDEELNQIKWVKQAFSIKLIKELAQIKEPITVHIQNQSWELAVQHCTGEPVNEVDEFIIQLSQAKQAIQKETSREELERVVHDLRGPMGSVMGFADVIKEMLKNGTKYMEYIKTSTEKLASNLDSLLLPHSQEKVEQIAFGKFLQQIIFSLDYQIQDRGITIQQTVKNKQHFYQSSEYMYSILQNIIENSIKYYDASATDPFVKVNIQDIDHGVEIIIEDNGLGIEPTRVKDFNAGNLSHYPSKGLKIIRENILRLNGKVTLSSEGKGISYKVFIPSVDMGK